MSIAKLEKLISKLSNLDTFIINESDKIIAKNQKVLISQNVQQMEEGKEYTEGDIEYKPTRKSPAGKYGKYSKGYEKYKEGYGGEVRVVDLRLTGEFHRSIALLQMNPGVWRFVSEDEKAPFLIANYGTDIFGIAEERLDIFSTGMGVELQQRVDKYLTI